MGLHHWVPLPLASVGFSQWESPTREGQSMRSPGSSLLAPAWLCLSTVSLPEAMAPVR